MMDAGCSDSSNGYSLYSEPQKKSEQLKKK
jgi:hypothetical protein